MAELKVYNQDGKSAGKIELKDEVFAQEYNEALIHQVVVAQLANKRQGTKCTLTRSEVRGGGVKPWRQKGTGRARQGSIRAPQWIKGGVVFAPKPRDFSQKINKKMKEAAMKSALSKKLADGEITAIKTIELPEVKTREMVKVLENLKLSKSILIVTDVLNEDVIRAARNIEGVDITYAEVLNVYDLVKYSKVLATSAALKKIEEVYA